MRASRRIATVLLITGAVAGTACRAGTSVTAPAAPSLSVDGAAPVGFQEGVASFMVRPGEARSFVFGDHKITFSPNAICDPRTSTYGPGEWDAPCDVVRTPTRITVTSWT